jgi:soluble lytic murein transglycosylase-like protein
MLALGYISIFAGALLTIAGVTGSSLASVAKGSPDRANELPGSPAASPTAAGVTGSTAAGSEPGSGGSTWRATQAAIAKSKGWSLADWNAVVQRESGGDPNSRNSSSGAYGLGQFLGSTAQQYAPQGALSSNPVLQIKAMAAYIADRYGTPSAALAHERAYGWY